MLQLTLLILAIMFVAMLIPQFLVRSIIGPLFRVFVIPGVIVHELAHALFCVLTGAKVQRIRLFKASGGDVTHQPSKIPFVGPLLITFAPMVIGLFLIILIARIIAPDLSNVPNAVSISEFPKFLWAVVDATNWTRPVNLLWLYFILSIGATVAPSWQDLKNSWFPLAVILIFIVLILKTNLFENSLDQFGFAFMPYLTLVLFILLVIACLAGVIYLLSSLFGIK